MNIRSNSLYDILSIAYNPSTMKPAQNFSNHMQLYPPFHFFLFPILVFVIGVSIYEAVCLFQDSLILSGLKEIATAVVLFMVTFLSRGQCMIVQDRVIRHEFSTRYEKLTSKEWKEISEKLTKSQIIALRFAGDKEFASLIEKTIK
jgi:predicted aminopeptidase